MAARWSIASGGGHAGIIEGILPGGVYSSNPDPGIVTATALGARQDIGGETADNIEGGFKSEWFGKRLLVNLTIFSTLVRGYQANEAVGVGNTATKFLANVGALRSKAWSWRPRRRLRPGCI